MSPAGFLTTSIGSLLWLVAAAPNSAWVSPVRRTTTTASPATKTTSRSAVPKEATFGMGCFWEPAESLLEVDGVLDTVSGYTGNPKFDKSKTGAIDTAAAAVPSYDNVCYGRQWVEGVRVTYDPARISYPELLDAFFEAQKPKLGSRQYGSIIFPHDDQQLQDAQQWKQTTKETKDGFSSDWTEVEYPKSGFYRAEGYHQNYWQKQRPRFALLFGLLAITTGFGKDTLYDASISETVETVANGATVFVGLAMTAERFIDAKVVRLD